MITRFVLMMIWMPYIFASSTPMASPVLSQISTPTNENSQVFDLKKATQFFDHINIKLSTQNLNITDLNVAVNTLSKLANQADQCNTEMQKKINNLGEFIAQDASEPGVSKQSADLIYLNNQRNKFSNHQAQCRLFSIRAKEAIDAYKSTIALMIQKKTLTRGLSLWQTGAQFIEQPVDPKLVPLLTSLKDTMLPPLSLFIVFFLSALLASYYTLAKLKKYFTFQRVGMFYNMPIVTISLLTFSICALLIYFYTLYDNPNAALYSHGPRILWIFSFYLLGLLTIATIFKQKPIRGYFLLHQFDIVFFQRFLWVSLTIEITSLIGHPLLQELTPAHPLTIFLQSGFLFVILISSLCFIRYFCHVHQHLPFIRRHTASILGCTTILIIATLCVDILGYHLLANHLTRSGLTTIFLILIIYLITLNIHNLYLSLYENSRLVFLTAKYFDYKKNQTYYEFLILKCIAQFLIVAIGIYIIGESWDFIAYYVERFYANILDGVHFASIMIYPMRIIYGMVTFCLLFLGFRLISTQVMRNHQFKDGEETQVALASILTYIGFSFSLICGLLLAGFDFTGLAIIAGALSVGIGLGLQSIVNNFVSGIILLIEKPIRPGDRINIDGIEGFVKKIRVRSTQIITPAREDIIIPNSDLITKRVTNYMFTDNNMRINCEVGVAYGTDTTLVKNVLMDIANQHEDVIKTGRSKPLVLFRSFGESAMLFQLWCLIKDVNKRFVVQSDLNYAIEEAFRKHNISQPFPQRELHLKISE